MKTSCNIIKDLLPLYHDNVCSAETRLLVEEHLKECDSCKIELEDIHKEFNCPNVKTNAAKPLKAIAAVWKKDKIKSFYKGAVITILSIALLTGVFVGLTQWKIIPVSADLIELSDISQLEDGRIVYHMSIKDDKDLHYIKFTLNSDGSYYMTPMRAIIEGKRKMNTGLFNNYFTVDLSQIRKDHEGSEVTFCYIGKEGDALILWQKNVPLPAADTELEKIISESDS